MSKEYVPREEVIKILEKHDLSAGSTLGYHSGAIECAISEIEMLPAADVVEVRHGEWILRHVGAGHYWECSVCHENPCIYVTKNTKYCPNCGAKMNKEDGE